MNILNSEDLCVWLRSNSSGIYRPSSEAADMIERLKYQLNVQLNDCINFNGGELTEAIMRSSSRLLKELD